MEYRIIRSRRKTIAIEITPAGDILVRCPVRMSQREIRRFVERKARWISAHLPQTPALPPFTLEELAALEDTARQVIPPRVAQWADSLGISYGRVTIRCQHTRWGSCSGKGNLNFNCLLLLAPEPVADYVIVHELCHRTHMNHSPAFWAEVEKAMPDYAVQKQWLKTHGRQLIARIPHTKKEQL